MDLLAPIKAAYRWTFDAIDTTRKRRRAASTTVKSEDDHVTAYQRRALVANGRDVVRNYSVAAWAIRRHLDYVATFNFQARTGDDDLNAALERLVTAGGSRGANDVAGRHSLARMIRLTEARRVIDGDCFLLKRADGRLQAIEGDRVRTPNTALPQNVGFTNGDLTHGVKLNRFGRATHYVVNRRTKAGGFEFERVVRSSNMLHHACWDRFDQVRGFSPLIAALNPLRDVYEAADYALAKAKVAQLFGLVFYREAAEALGDVENEEDDPETDRSGYKVDFGKGPLVLDLDPGDKAEFLENKTPAAEFDAFCQTMIAVALKALDIPFSFFDESHTNYSGARQALLQYEQSVATKRADLVEVLNDILRWRVRLWVADGLLTLPRGFVAADLTWEWVPAGLPWIDPLKEIKADVEALNAGLTSRHRIAKRRGEDFAEIADELDAEAKRLGLDGPIPRKTPAASTDPGSALARAWIAAEEQKQPAEV